MWVRYLVLVACLGLQAGLWKLAASPVEKPAAAGPGVDAHGDLLPAGAKARLGTIRFRHGSAIYRLAASADGKRLATIGLDRQLRLWNAADGREIRAMPITQFEAVWSLAFSPDSRALLAADTSSAIHMWNATTGDAILTFQNLEASIATAAWSPDGKTIITTDHTETMRLWDFATGKELRQIKWQPPARKAREEEDKGILGLIRWYANKLGDGDPEEAGKGGPIVYNSSTAAFSPDGKYLTVSGPLLANGQAQHQHFRTYEVKTWKPLRSWTTPGAQSQLHLVYSPDGKTIAVNDQQEALRLYDAASGKELRTLVEANATAFAFAPNGKTVAVASQSNRIQILDVETGKEQKVLLGAVLGHTALAYLPNGKLAAGGSANQIQFWDLATGKEISPFGGHVGPIANVMITPDGKRILTGGSDGNVRVWDSAGRFVREIWPTVPAVNAFGNPSALSRDGKHFAVATAVFDADQGTIKSADLYIYELETGKELLKISLGAQPTGAVTFSSDGRRLAAAVAGGARVWDVATGKQIRHFATEMPRNDDEAALEDPAAGMYNTLAFSSDDRTLLTVGNNPQAGIGMFGGGAFAGGQPAATPPRTAVLWEIASGKKRREFMIESEAPEDPGAGVMFDPRGRAISTVAMNRGLGARFASRGKDLVIGMGSNIMLFDAARGAEQRRYGGVRVNGPSAVFSPDGKLLAAGTHEGGICIWDVATATLRCRTPGHRSVVNDLAFSADGQTLTSISADSTGLIWDVAALLARKDLPDEALPPQRLQGLWTDLGKAEADQAETARNRMVAAPAEVVPFLGTQLKPHTAKLDAADFDRHIKDLDGATFDIRERAMKALEQAERSAEAALRKALAEPQTSLEVRRRMERLLERLDAPIIEPERLRELRAIEVLEDIGTPEAKEILERLAKGTPGLTLTREAKAALARIK